VIVVLLPTVCLLWFIARTVNNERLAMEQRLVNIYQEKIADSRKLNDRLLDEKLSLRRRESLCPRHGKWNSSG
jgi:hypothetical protein